MKIDPAVEEAFPLSEGKRNLPGAPSYQRLYNAVKRGALLPDGSRLKLETVRLFGVMHTSYEAFSRWTKAVNQAWEERA